MDNVSSSPVHPSSDLSNSMADLGLVIAGKEHFSGCWKSAEI